MSNNASAWFSRAQTSVCRAVSAILIAASFWLVTTAPAAAEGSIEFERGGMYATLGNKSASKKVTRKLRRRIKRTNIGGIARKKSRRYTRRSKRRTKSRRRRGPVRVASLGRSFKYASVQTKRSARKSNRRRLLRNRRSNRKSRRVRVASLGRSFKYARSPKTSKPKRLKSITRGNARGVRWVASSRCLNSRLKSAIYYVALNYGRVRVNSTCRSRRRNRRVGGARRSLHLTGNAADIRIWGNVRAAARYLRGIAGGYKHYGGGLFHIDTGPRRRW